MKEYMRDPKYVLTRYLGTAIHEIQLDDLGNKIGELELRDIEPETSDKHSGTEHSSENNCDEKNHELADKIHTLERLHEHSGEVETNVVEPKINTEANGAVIKRRESKKSTALTYKLDRKATKALDNRFHTVNPNVNVDALVELKEKLKFDLTKQDYKKTPYKDKLILDHRSFCKYYWDNVQDSSLIISIFWKRTILKPYYLSLTEFFHKFVLSLALNALFMSDDLIANGSKPENQGIVNIIF